MITYSNPRVVDGGGSLQMWKLAANMLNKEGVLDI
jgi:hypothetical protein